MHKAVLTILLAVVSGSSFAQWFAVRGNAEATIYINPTTVHMECNTAKMWHLVDFKTGQELEHFGSYMSLRAESESDCEKKRLRFLDVTYYAKNMVRGAVVDSENEPDKWTPISPGSRAEVLWKVACWKL